MLRLRGLPLLIAVLFLLSSTNAFTSPQDFPETPEFAFTEEDYETTEVQIGQLRLANWYQFMYGQARQAYLAEVQTHAAAARIYEDALASTQRNLTTFKVVAGISTAVALVTTCLLLILH